jgi:hypothetical protein
LNITVGGFSVDLSRRIDQETSDEEIRRVAVEALRDGELPSLSDARPSSEMFDHYVVDRAERGPGERRIYLRPAVPFA